MTQAVATEELHVLLVEDNPADASLLEELLEDGHYRVALYCANDGYDAFDFLNRHHKYQGVTTKTDAILLDLALPRMNGYEVLQRIRSTPSLSTIPVIVLTTSRDPKDREACLALGAKEFISKPYNLEEYELLVDRLASQILPQLCRNAKAPTPNAA